MQELEEKLKVMSCKQKTGMGLSYWSVAREVEQVFYQSYSRMFDARLPQSACQCVQ